MEGVNWITGVLVPYFNFFLFCGMLYFFASKAIQSAIRQKRDDYLKLAQDAQSARKEAQKQQEILNDKLRGLDKELDTIRQQSRKIAEEEALAIINNARELARSIQEQSENTLRQLEEECFLDLRNQLLAEVEKKVTIKLQNVDEASTIRGSIAQLKVLANEVAR